MKNRTKIIWVLVGVCILGLIWFVKGIQPFAVKVDSENLKKENATVFTDTTRTLNIFAEKEASILVLTKQILTTLKSHNYQLFAKFIHPKLGLRLSPYANIDTTIDVKFTADIFFERSQLPTKINWGNYDGSGDPILLTVENYFKRFVYSADYVHADKTSINTMIGSGNSINNLKEIYKNCNFTESYFAGFDKKYEGMDWSSLRLVYQKYNEKNYLIAMVHAQWTI